MNIDDLIRQANPVKAGNVPAGDSPPARRTLAQILTDHSDGGAPRRSRGARQGRRRTLIMGGVAAIAAAATAAALAWPAPREAPHKPPGAAPSVPATVAHPTTTHPTSGGPTTARQVLLTAAAHVLNSPTTGTYWRVQVTSGVIWPGGTEAHPYDITVATGYDQWNPKSPGQKEFEITQQLAARPATPADAAAWRAAGSPTTWHGGQFSHHNKNDTTLGAPWGFNLAATTVAPAPSATWTISDGTIGYIEGDEAGLNAAQLGQVPARPKAVAAFLRHYAEQTYCVQHPSSGCSSLDQIVWLEALYLLEDPVSAQVRSATFKVMASLPGVRLLGPMTDPLGRRGYGLAAGPQDPGNPNYNNPVKAVVIDPASGSLLATEDIGPVPRSVQCSIQQYVVGRKIPKGGPVIQLGTKHGKRLMEKCIGEPYLGRSYKGQVDEFVALVSAGWTNTSPSLPRSTQEDPTGFPGLPPAGP
jgi:hypothetical protein